MAFWKAVVLTPGIVVLALGLMYGASLIGLHDMWVAFLALVVRSASGSKMEQAPGVFIGAAYGLLLSLSVEALPDLYGDWAVAIPMLAIILTISCQINGLFPLFCNFSTFAFLTIDGSDVILDQRLQLEYLPNLGLDAVLSWILPLLIMKLRTRYPGGGEQRRNRVMWLRSQHGNLIVGQSFREDWWKKGPEPSVRR